MVFVLPCAGVRAGFHLFQLFPHCTALMFFVLSLLPALSWEKQSSRKKPLPDFISDFLERKMRQSTPENLGGAEEL